MKIDVFKKALHDLNIFLDRLIGVGYLYFLKWFENPYFACIRLDPADACIN